jgi:toxin ParE1/3/4
VAKKRRLNILIKQALIDIETDHERPGSKERPELMVEGARTYQLFLSRTKVRGTKVKEPTHFLLYRRRGEVIEVARVLHNARDLARHLPPDYRLPD